MTVPCSWRTRFPNYLIELVALASHRHSRETKGKKMCTQVVGKKERKTQILSVSNLGTSNDKESNNEPLPLQDKHKKQKMWIE